MNETLLSCENPARRQAVRASPEFNGLDYLEVGADQRTLTLYFIDRAPATLTARQVQITGGQRVTDLQVVDLRFCRQEDPQRDDCVVITVDRPGDFSPYRLCLVQLDANGRPTDQPLAGFDPRYACLEFSFKVACPSDLDCRPVAAPCAPPARVEPELNYLVKDYASFRQLLLDRLALIMPDWQERHVPDLELTLVELLAYVGDQLSYYQDAVATEAYLETARQRISVRRHVRLVDYRLHEGCNARAWVLVQTDTPVTLPAEQVTFSTGTPPNPGECFEPLGVQELSLIPAHNEIHFYTWGDRECCLPQGATSATLVDHLVPVAEPAWPDNVAPETPGDGDSPRLVRRLALHPGDYLLFEEVLGPQTGAAADADPAHRHVVRLTGCRPAVDALYHQPVLEITWAAEDALPFPFCLSAVIAEQECRLVENISVARGNLVLVDHGRRVSGEDLGTVPAPPGTLTCEREGRPAILATPPPPFRPPPLRQGPLIFREPLPETIRSATELLRQDPHQAVPQIALTGVRATPYGQVRTSWWPRPDLLDSRPGDPDFVVEVDNDGRAHLRFGDGDLGQQPAAGTQFTADYRVGYGPAGNVGAETITHLLLRDPLTGVTLKPRNPLPAQGGTAPELLAEAKLLAPYAAHHQLQRAITAEDYAALVMRRFNTRVQRAAATLRWTGSGYEVLVAVDPREQTGTDPALLAEIEQFLQAYRRIGHDIAVHWATCVPLDLKLTVCVQPTYLRGHVKAALLELFSNRRLPDGRPGFFHPDALTFGEGIMLSRVVAAARSVPGVEDVRVEVFHRYGDLPNGELEAGLLPLGPLEVARLDNDPNAPANGRLALEMVGGR